VFVEPERTETGMIARVLTILLTGRECPWRCVMCDLWKSTTPRPIPPGAIPTQIDEALARIHRADPATGDGLDARLVPECSSSGISEVKLYNSGSFFDPRAVPPEDLAELARLLIPFEAVTVESHARTVGRRCRDFADRLTGRLEVAIGLETAHPEALPRLNKQMDLSDFDRAARFLRDHGMDLRAFVLVGAPFVPPAESVRWAIRSVEHALAQGAAAVALIPARGGNGAMEQLAAEGWFTPPSLTDLELALEGSLGLGGVVTADLWDADRLVGCPACRTPRLERVRQMNLTGRAGPTVQCPECAP
jgi:hypothetical protein